MGSVRTRVCVPTLGQETPDPAPAAGSQLPIIPWPKCQPSPAQPRLSFYMSTVRDLHLRAEYPDVAAPHCSLLCSLSSLDLESEKLRQLTEVQVAAGCQTGDENNLNLNI